MEKIKVVLDRMGFWEKPTGHEIGIINNRIGKSVKELCCNQKDMRAFAELVGIDGHTFCPATFKGGIRNQENFEQQQFFALDFDNDTPESKISFEEVRARSEKYDLPIFFAYETFHSTDRNKFRVVFFNDISIPHRKVAEAMQLAMGSIFPEADPRCYTDVSKMYFGGKELIYYDEELPQINIESVFRGLTYFVQDGDKEKNKNNHHSDYKKQLSDFSEKTGIALTKKGFLDVSVTYDPTEQTGATQLSQDGENSPTAIIYSANNIIVNGEISPNKKYCIKLIDCTSKSSVVNSGNKAELANNQLKNHNMYRSSVLSDMRLGCRLLRDFENGERDMDHSELYGLATSLIQVETGIRWFQSIQSAHPNWYDAGRRSKWNRHLSYMKNQGYKPQCCDGFCPYHAVCNHGANILSTVRPKPGIMERIPGYREEFHSIEDVQDDTYYAIRTAYLAQDNLVHVINSMTGAGKSYSYLKLMVENPEARFLIATPTNLLKDEIFEKAKNLGIDVRKTPSLEKIKYTMPPKVWKHIQSLYKNGRHRVVHTYIHEQLEKRRIPCLEKYMRRREEVKNFDGNIITTHRYLLNMNEKRLREYDAIIIDEDIIFKSIIPNQEGITISALKKLSKKVTNQQLSKKIKRLVTLAKDHSCIELDSFEYDIEGDDHDCGFDLSAFCMAKKFYVRKSSKEPNLKEDTVVFLKPTDLKNVKYIMVSATVDEKICQKYFGEKRVKFYKCKRAKYMGILNQYPGKSMSRTSVANNPGIVRRLMKHFNMSEDQVITFMKENIGNLHFGNTEGSNTLEGQDILVAGTPYHADFLYKLVAFSLGLDFDENEEVSSQVVTHNGYRFRFTTFGDEGLRAIQFWMIESELEQAVGRARLLRNSCEVHLCSNFPLSQATMVDDFDYEKE